MLSRSDALQKFWENDSVLENLDPNSHEFMQLLCENEKLAVMITGDR